MFSAVFNHIPVAIQPHEAEVEGGSREARLIPALAESDPLS